MAVSRLKVMFPCDVKKVWDIVTDLEHYAWRSDLSKIEVIYEDQFVEYTKDGYATTFQITAHVPYQRWEFDMENNNIKGHWIGVFTQKGNGTEIDFIEDVAAKKLWMRPFVKAYLQKQQALYVSDLQKALL